MDQRRLTLIGGGAGVGKTSAAHALAESLGAGWLQLDTIWLALTDAAAEGSARRRLLDIDDRLRHGDEAPEVLLEQHVAASRAICAALPRALRFELQTHSMLVADGAWLLPDFVAGLELDGVRISAVFIHEVDPDLLRGAMTSRRSTPMTAPWHERSARLTWLYGNWLATEAARLGLPVLASRPFDTLVARLRAATDHRQPS